MTNEKNQIELIKEKAKEENNIKPVVTHYRAYDKESKKIVTKEKVIRSGKEGNLFNRFTLIAIFLVIELILLTAVYLLLINAFLWILLVPYAISFVFVCRVAISSKNSDSKIAWIIFLLTLAPIAFIVYLSAGEMSTTPFKSYKIKRINSYTKYISKKVIPDNLPSRVKQDCNYLQNISDYVPYFNGSTKYFPTGEAFFEDVLTELQKAKKSIFLEFFIISEGHLSNEIFSILIQKVKEGVDVRIISDGLGSHSTLSLLKIKKIRNSGIKIVAFEPVLPFINFFVNYRDHRKIIVIDSCVGYTGGTNIADEYINAKTRFGNWKDASLKIEGEAVKSLTLMFLRMWEYSSRKKPDYSLFLNSSTKFEDTNKNVIIPYADGPSEKQEIAKGVYTNIISNAQKTLYIMTPYFIVDSNITDLLKAKAQSGVDVRLIIPGTPDKKIVYALTLYNCEKQIENGVRIYKYSPGFIHSKVMLSDDECAVVGSVNMDFRSFYQQYECAVYLSEYNTLKSISDDFVNTFNECQEITSINMTKRNILKRMLLAFIRLFSPLM